MSKLQGSICEQQLFYIEQYQTQLRLQGIFVCCSGVDAIFLHGKILIVSLTKRQQQEGEMKRICIKNTHC